MKLDNKPKQFKDGSSSWWLNGKHFHLNENNELILVAGGKEDRKEFEIMLKYIKNNKKVYKPRSKNIFEENEFTM